VFDDDPMDNAMSELARRLLRERAAALIAETCAWSVGLSDQPHFRFRSGRPVASGVTLGARAESGLPLSGDEAGRLELGNARPGSFQDALNALTAEGAVLADRFDVEVLEPFVLQTCVAAAERARRTWPAAWHELVDNLGEDDDGDLGHVVRAAEWEAPLRTEAEQLVLAALADLPLIEVEAEGLPLSLVRAAEAATRAAAPVSAPDRPDEDRPDEDRPDENLAGALFLAGSALCGAGLDHPVPPAQAGRLLEVLLAEGLTAEELPAVLAHLPVERETAAKLVALLEAEP
jgi:hypothetical protein